jgi:transcription-repair coupling factor (superfamily II helicase)
MKGYFVNNSNSEFFNSEIFSSIIHHVKLSQNRYSLRETNGKLVLSFTKVKSVNGANNFLSELIVATEKTATEKH